MIRSLPGRQNIAYPGPLFATEYSELAELARGDKRGFYLVEYDGGGVQRTEFIPVEVAQVKEISYSSEGKSPLQVTEDLMKKADDPEIKGKVVLLTVEGMLGEGKTSDVGFQWIRKRFAAAGPLILMPNFTKLTSRELAAPPGPPQGLHALERDYFEKGIAAVKTDEPSLKGEKGVAVAVDLLRALKEPKKENENRAEFEDRTSATGLGILGLEDA
jgi:hypothetical protein